MSDQAQRTDTKKTCERVQKHPAGPSASPAFAEIPQGAEADVLQRVTADLRFISPSTVLTLQRTRGNCAAQSWIRSKLAGNATPTSRIQPQVQRQDAPDAVTDPQRALMERILADVRTGGGITVAVYVSTTPPSGHPHPQKFQREANEFRRQAAQYAMDHGALGITNGTVREGVAMELTQSMPTLLASLSAGLERLLESYPDLTRGECFAIPIQTLAIFTHGQTTGLMARESGNYYIYTMRQLEPWVQSIAPYLSASPLIPLYACSTAGAPPQGVPFAEAMQLALQMELEAQHGPEAEAVPTIWGHTTTSHTTANPNIAEISGEATAASTELIPELGRRLAALIIERAGGSSRLTEDQCRKIERDSVQAIRTHVFPMEGPVEPLNTFKREIPQMGIERVWHDLSLQGTPNFSDLALTPEARIRVGEGFQIYHERFLQQLLTLEQNVKSVIAIEEPD